MCVLKTKITKIESCFCFSEYCRNVKQSVLDLTYSIVAKYISNSCVSNVVPTFQIPRLQILWTNICVSEFKLLTHLWILAFHKDLFFGKTINEIVPYFLYTIFRYLYNGKSGHQPPGLIKISMLNSLMQHQTEQHIHNN